VFVIGNELWKVNILATDEFSIQEVDFAETTISKSHAYTHNVNLCIFQLLVIIGF